MADKKPASKPQVFQLDKDALFKEHKVPLVLKPVIGSAIDWINSFDANHDGVPEIAKWFPIVIKAAPHILELAKQVDWVQLFKYFARDKSKAQGIVDEIKAISAVIEPVLEAEVKVLEGGA